MDFVWFDMTEDERASLRESQPRPKALRLVHDPDTGCGRCLCFDRKGWWCKAARTCSLELESPAPPWCPLRAGDVVVSAK